MTLPIICDWGLPSSSALTKSPTAGMNVSSEPAKTPGSESGKVTRMKASLMRNVPTQRRRSAPTTAGTTRARAMTDPSASTSTPRRAPTIVRPVATARRTGPRPPRSSRQVDLLERDVERQRHERQEVVGDPGDDRERRREHPEASSGRRPSVLERPEDDAVSAEDDLPRDRAEQEAREERRDDEEQQQVLVAPPRNAIV